MTSKRGLKADDEAVLVFNPKVELRAVLYKGKHLEVWLRSERDGRDPRKRLHETGVRAAARRIQLRAERPADEVHLDLSFNGMLVAARSRPEVE
jgi:hypothetical protein